MKTLQTPQFINPFVFRQLPAQGIVTDGKVHVLGDMYLFDEEPYPDGTQVQVSVGRYRFLCQSLAEIEAEKQDRERQRQEQERKENERELRQRQEAERFNASLNIPVRWKPEIKHVLGGLTECSSGNGWVRNTVVHVFLQEELHDGRLRREKYSFLCSQQKGFHFGELIDPEYNDLEGQPVTCKACLRMAQRWKKERQQ